MPVLVPEKQRRFALEVVEKLRQAGYVAYWAGGCVRDQLLGRTPKDYDVATSATPAAIKHVFSPRRTLEIGAAFGVVSVLGPRGAGQIEVATFRRDLGYSDGRHPDAVAFSGPEEDARRRDFTINGLFYDPIAHEVVDYVGGREDLRRGLVRAIGEPRERFEEDKLRLLRAVRFAATFAFELEPSTRAALEVMARQITAVSPERIAQEMRLMLVHPQRCEACRLLMETGLLEAILPEAAALKGVDLDKPGDPQADVLAHTLRVLAELRAPSFPLALAALLHDAGKPETVQEAGGRRIFPDHERASARIAEAVCRRWKLSNKELERVVWLVRHHNALRGARQMRWSKLQPFLVSAGIEELLDLHEADKRAGGRETANVDYCRALLKKPRDELDPPPLVTGHDLLGHGIPQGKHFKTLLEKVREAQLEGEVRSKSEALELVDRLLAEGLADERSK